MESAVDSAPAARDTLGEGVERRFVIAVLAATMALGIMPMVAIGVLAPLLIDDLDISTADVGVLVAIVAGVSAVLSPLAGHYADGMGDRSALLFVLALGIAGLLLMAAAFDYASMAVAIGVAGVCRAGCNPATNRVISVRVPRGRRGWVTGVKQSGEAVAIVLAASLVPAIAVLWGWRAAVLLLAALAGLALIGAALCVHGSLGGAANAASRGGRLRASIHWVNVYCLAMGAAGGAVTAYLPLYAHEEGSFGVAAAGATMVLAGAVALVFRILWSSWSETRFGFPASLASLALLGAVSGIVLAVASSVGGFGFWLGAALWGASGLAFGSVAMMAVMGEADDHNTGRASGLTVLWFGIGFTVTPPLFGWMVEQNDGYGAGFALVTCLYAVSAVIILLGRKSFRPSRSLRSVPAVSLKKF
jgi:predicted MFS family arabinose efflux permease